MDKTARTHVIERIPYSVVAVALCALAVRIFYLLQIQSMPFFYELVGDALGYYQWAERIAEGDWLGSQPFYQAPLYPYFLAGCFKGLGLHLFAVRCVQACLGAAGAGLLWFVTWRLWGGKIALIAGLMWAFYPPAIFFDGLIQKTSLGAFLICALMALLTCFHRLNTRGTGATNHRLETGATETGATRRRFLPVLVGACLGLLVLTRENAMVWVPVVGAWFLFQGNQQSRRSSTQQYNKRWVTGFWHTFAFFVGLAAILMPIALCNAYVGGQWSLTTFQAGSNFYIGNSLQADGRYRPLVPGHETPEFEREDAIHLAERAVGKKLKPSEISRYWFERAFDDIESAPGRWVALMGRKLLMVINAYEVSDVESLYIYAAHSGVLRVLAPVWHLGILCPLAVYGVLLSWQKRGLLGLFYAMIVTMIFAVALFYVMGRYRFVLVPLMIPPAAYGVWRIWRLVRYYLSPAPPSCGPPLKGGRWGSSRLRGFRFAVPAGLAVAMVCNFIPVHPVVQLNAHAMSNLGVAYAKQGQLQQAQACFERAIADYPRATDAHYNLVLAIAKRGDPEKAMKYYRSALVADPSLHQFDNRLGAAFETLGYREQAIVLYEYALSADPSDVVAKRALHRLRR